MKNLPLIFSCVFLALAASWGGLVYLNIMDLGQLKVTSSELIRPDTQETIAGMRYQPAATKDNPDPKPELGISISEDTQYPLPIVGLAEQGKQVYISMGCAYCHTQQVRRKGFGSDYERGWGLRASVPRDYIRQDQVLLGTMRTGPDLMNVGERLEDPLWHHQHLYNPEITSEGSTMPAYHFLYEIRDIKNNRMSIDAIQLTAPYGLAPGLELVPTKRAKALVAYLLSLRLDYDLPEAKRIEPEEE